MHAARSGSSGPTYAGAAGHRHPGPVSDPDRSLGLVLRSSTVPPGRAAEPAGTEPLGGTTLVRPQAKPPMSDSHLPLRTDVHFRAADRLRSGSDFRRIYSLRRSVERIIGCPLRSGELPGAPTLGPVGIAQGGRGRRAQPLEAAAARGFRTSRSRLPLGLDLIAIPRSRQPPTLEALQAELVDLAARLARRIKLPASARRPSP